MNWARLGGRACAFAPRLKSSVGHVNIDSKTDSDLQPDWGAFVADSQQHRLRLVTRAPERRAQLTDAHLEHPDLARDIMIAVTNQ